MISGRDCDTIEEVLSFRAPLSGARNLLYSGPAQKGEFLASLGMPNLAGLPSGSVQNQTVTPGFISITSMLGTSFCNWPGVPVNTGNVPKCMGMTVFACRRLEA